MCVCACARVCVFCVCLSIYIYMYIIHKSTRKYVHTYSIASAGVASSVCGRLPPFVHHKCHILTAHIIFRYQYTYIHSHTHTHTHGHTHTHTALRVLALLAAFARDYFLFDPIMGIFGQPSPRIHLGARAGSCVHVCMCVCARVKARAFECEFMCVFCIVCVSFVLCVRIRACIFSVRVCIP